MSLIGLHHAAQRRDSRAVALEWLERAMAVERALRLEELGGMMGPLRLLRAELLCQEGRVDEAMADLRCYVDRGIGRWAGLRRGDAVKSELYDKLNVHASGISAAYLARNMRTILEQSESAALLGDREDFQALLAKLKELEGQ